MIDAALSSVPAGWEGLLDQDEIILWQGRPDTRIAISAAQLPEIGIGLFFVGFSLFWMIGASQAGGMFWMFGLIFFFAGLGIFTRSNVLAAQRRRYTHYTLTSRRAIIATDLPLVGRSLKSYPITAHTALEMTEQGDFGTIAFARSVSKDSEGGTNTQYIGFERISEVRTVFAMMRKIQTGMNKAEGEIDA